MTDRELIKSVLQVLEATTEPNVYACDDEAVIEMNDAVDEALDQIRRHLENAA